MNGYVILADSRLKKGEKVVLVDRAKCKEHFWSEFITNALVFNNLTAANAACAKLKYNKPEVWRIDKAKIRLQQVSVTYMRCAISDALDRKMQEWHDDHWYEGIND